jgi:hypothetical protein
MSDQPTKANAHTADRCPVCPDPTCPVRSGTFAQAYHHIAMLREAYEMNGDPKSDTVLMGLDPDLEPRPRIPVRREGRCESIDVTDPLPTRRPPRPREQPTVANKTSGVCVTQRVVLRFLTLCALGRGGGASIESRSFSVVGCSNPANASFGGDSCRPSSDRTPKINAQTEARTTHRTFMYRNPGGVKGIKAAETTASINITIQVFT